MVGKIHSRPEARKTPGKKFGTTTYKKGGVTKRATGGKIKKMMAGGPMKQGYNARLDESLGARHPGARGSMAGRRAESKGMETAMGHGAYSGAATMAKKGGKISKKMHGGKVHTRKKK